MNNIILRYFTLHLKNVIERSQKFARRKKGKKVVDVPEILQSLACEEGSVGFNLLKNLSAFPKIKGSVKDIGIPGKNSPTKKNLNNHKTISFSRKVHEIIVGAIKFAQEFQFPYVGTEHLLFSILERAEGETFQILGENKIEIKQMIGQLRKVMRRVNDSSEEPLFYMDYPQKIGAGETAPTEIISEISELFHSLLQRRKNKEINSTSPGFFHPYRPSFGVVMSPTRKTESLLAHFGRDLNKEVIEKKVDPVVGREKEIDDLVCILMRKTKNNPVLVGEPGVGKTAVVAGLARKIVEKEVPPTLVGKQVITLDLGLLVAGTSFRGEFEDRFKRVLEEAESDPNIILFVDELHNLVGAGSAQGSLDAANIMKPALARGLLRCIGATTVEEYHRYIEKDGALERRFQPVWIKEPGVAGTVKILKGIKRFYESYHNVKISDHAIEEAVRLSSRYISDRFLPDKAIDLLDESAAYVIQDEHRQSTTKKLQKLETQREKVCRMKEKMLENNNLEIAATLLKSERNLSEIINGLKKKVTREKRFTPVVDEKDVAEVIARRLGLPLELVMETPAERLKNLPRVLQKMLKGQKEVIESVTATLRRLLVGIADPERPSVALLFVGPTGVGKTYLAKLIAKELFIKPDSFIRVDMSEFGEKHTVSRLLGSPPGYVGYGEMNNFTDKIRKNPYSLILFDEIEKAHPEVFHILLSVLEDGFLTDGMGRKINFKNTIIVFTSNLSNDEFLKRAMGFSEENLSEKIGRRKKTAVKKRLEDFLRPEFVNRLSGIMFFKPLGSQEMKEIAALEIGKLKKRLLTTKKVKLEVDKKIIGKLAKISVNKKEGARILRRLIQEKIEGLIARGLLEERIEKGATARFFLDKKDGKKFKMSVKLPKKPEVYGRQNKPQTKNEI